MKKRTAKTVDQVRAWIETVPHHIVDSEYPKGVEYDKNGPGHVVLRGYHDQLRIPQAIWKQCHIKSGGKFDSRMYRWDFDEEFKQVWGK